MNIIVFFGIVSVGYSLLALGNAIRKNYQNNETSLGLSPIEDLGLGIVGIIFLFVGLVF